MSLLYGFVGKVEKGRITYTSGSTWLPIEFKLSGHTVESFRQALNDWFSPKRRKEIAKGKDIDGWCYAASKEEYLKEAGNYHYLIEGKVLLRYNPTIMQWEEVSK